MKYTRFKLKREQQIVSGSYHGDHVQSKTGQSFALDEVTLLAPVLPSKMVCVGLNYVDHAKEFSHDVPQKPLLFLKPPSALNDPGAPIVLPDAPRLDYEGEIAVVINQRCKDVPESEAASTILGYTCFNDISDREAQGWEKSWVRSKAFDTSGCLGPVVVSPDELSDPLSVVTRLNGEEKQRGDTSQFAFSIPFLISAISKIMTLERGDVIATGTPAGVGPLRSGDVVEVEIPGVGVLKNFVA